MLGLLLFIQLGRAQVKIYTASLSGPAEAPPNTSPGTGTATVTINTVTNTMRVQCTFSGLTGNTINAHIHAATSVANTGNVGVATQTPSFSGFPSGVKAGTYDRVFDMTSPSSYNAAYVTLNGGTPTNAFTALIAALDAEKAYLNIHTTLFAGGEIRGFLKRTWYFDYDNDGVGNSAKPLVSATQPRKYVGTAGDCRDWDPLSYPGASEIGDGIDNNCNGQVDEGLSCLKTWYYDGDGDNYGADAYTRLSCIQHNNYVPLGGDCRNWDASVYPGATELCDGKDNDCDGQTDEACSLITGTDDGKPETATKPLAKAESATQQLDLRLWPNPARDMLTVTLDAFVPNQKMELTLMQADGKVQQAQSLMPTVRGQQVRMNLTKYPAGLYLLQVRQGFVTETKRVIILP